MAGGQKRGRTQRRHFRQNRENVWKYNKKGKPDGAEVGSNPDPSSDLNPSWQPFPTQNPSFEEYYKEQGIVATEEWDAFISILQNPLPAAFRINSSGQFFKDILTQMEEDFVKSLQTNVSSEYELDAIRPLPWYPGKLAWHLNFSRMQLRKNQTLERFHEFLKQENEIGNITRQEAVSMVPPLFLDVSPGHYVLDMCAAPGSKTFQLLELMHNSSEVSSLPTGMVIANDVDVQRCNLLIHQTKRMCSANLIVTNHEAQHFPNCRLSSGFKVEGENDLSSVLSDNPTSLNGQEQLNYKELLFDRVLCDVPCSGDGTLRKAPDIWRKWHSGMGNGLHNLQVQITMRGLTLLKVGGRMVYSTCSMNPVENEAVISEVLSRCGEAVELLDVSTEIPELIRHPGLKQWKVRDKGLWLSSFRDVPTHRKGTILPSMFPSGSAYSMSFDEIQDGKDAQETNSVDKKLDDLASLQRESVNDIHKDPDLHVNGSNGACKEKSNFPLEWCMRIVPHDQNSGAFFIAVLRKLSPLQSVAEKTCSHSKYTINRRNGIHGDKSETAGDKAGEEKGDPGNVPGQCLGVVDSSDAKIGDEMLDVKMNSQETASSGLIYNNNESVNKEPFDIGDGQQKRERGSKGMPQIQGKWRGIDPVVFFKDIMAIESIRTFYGIQESLPMNGHLVSRNEDSSRVKRIYYISKSIQEVLKLNFHVGQRLKIASLGLKLFERQASKDGSVQCAFRISSEGLPLILPFISKQILHASLVDFQHLLQYRNIKFAEFVDADFSNKASELLSGCCVVVLKKEGQASDAAVVDEQTIAIVCWKGRASLSVLVSEIDGNELLQRLSVRFGIGKSVVLESTGSTAKAPDDQFSEDIKENRQESAIDQEDLESSKQQ